MRLIDRLSHRQFVGLLALLASASILLVYAAPFMGSNYKIYSVVGAYFREFGRLPEPGQALDGGVSGSYADFPGLNLWLYRTLLGYGDASEVLWATYQIGAVAIAGVLLAKWGTRTGLTTTIARLTALTALFCALVVAVPLEDKTHYFWLPALAFLACSRSLWAGSSLLGLFAGWTVLAPLAVLISAIRSGRSAIVRFAATGLSVAVALGAFFAAGPLTATLLSNRSTRESEDAFWYSIWQFGGPVDSPLVRVGFSALLGIAALVAYARGWTSLPAAVVVMSVGTLLASNSTIPSRLIMLLPLGVYVCSRHRQQVLLLLGVAGWSSLLVIGELTGCGTDHPAQSGMLHTLQILYVNAPLLIILLLWLGLLPWSDLPRTQTPKSVFEPSAPSSRGTPPR